MAKAMAHPDHRLISGEDVQGTLVYGPGNEEVGEIDHLLIEKVSGRVVYAVMSFGGFLGLALLAEMTTITAANAATSLYEIAKSAKADKFWSPCCYPKSETLKKRCSNYSSFAH